MRKSHKEMRKSHKETRKSHKEMRKSHKEMRKSHKEMRKCNIEMRKSRTPATQAVDRSPLLLPPPREIGYRYDGPTRCSSNPPMSGTVTEVRPTKLNIVEISKQSSKTPQRICIF